MYKINGNLGNYHVSFINNFRNMLGLYTCIYSYKANKL